MSKVLFLEQNDKLESKFLKNSKNLIYFFATWCGPCMKYDQTIKKISLLKEFEDVFFTKVDVDLFPIFISEYKITSIPFVLLVLSDTETDSNKNNTFLNSDQKNEGFLNIENGLNNNSRGPNESKKLKILKSQSIVGMRGEEEICSLIRSFFSECDINS